MPSLASHHSSNLVKHITEKFNRPVTIHENGCWLWEGAVDKGGYARLGELLVYGYAYRAAGYICDKGKELCHTCTSKNCINPDHLYAGTHKQNMEDAARAGGIGRRPKATDEQRSETTRLLAEGVRPRDVSRIVDMSEAWVHEFKKGVYKYAKLG